MSICATVDDSSHMLFTFFLSNALSEFKIDIIKSALLYVAGQM